MDSKINYGNDRKRCEKYIKTEISLITINQVFKNTNGQYAVCTNFHTFKILPDIWTSLVDCRASISLNVWQFTGELVFQCPKFYLHSVTCQGMHWSFGEFTLK